MTNNPPLGPLSIERAAEILKFDRRTVRAAIRAAEKIDRFEAEAVSGQGYPLYSLASYCAALELHHIRLAEPDLRRWCQRLADDYERALAIPCPRCDSIHREAPLIPMPGRTYPPEIREWQRAHNFPARYKEAGPDQAR